MKWGSEQIQTKVCPVCDYRFFTQVGLDEHARACRPTTRFSPEGLLALQMSGSRMGKARTSTRRRCLDCGLESHVPGIGKHQEASGHTGWTDAT